MNNIVNKYVKYCDSAFGRNRRNMIFSQIKCNCTDYKNIFDLGCGIGSVTELFLSEEVKIRAIDLSKKLLDKFESRIKNRKFNSTVEISHMDIFDFINSNLIPKESLILCHNVIDYIVNKSDFLRKLKSISKPDTYLSLTVVNLNGELNNLILNRKFQDANDLLNTREYISNTFKEKITLHSLKEWQEIITDTGWEIINWYGIGYFGYIIDENIYDTYIDLENKLLSIDSFKKNSNILHFVLKNTNRNS